MDAAAARIAERLLSHRQANGTIATNPYRKWQGPHWTLYCLAQVGYPPGDRSLLPLRLPGRERGLVIHPPRPRR